MDEARKHLHRTNDGVIAGVASGFAHYLGIDPVIMRLIFVVLTVLTSGSFVLIYIALWLVLPKEDADEGPVDVRPDSAESARNCACGEAACKDEKGNATATPAPIVTVALLVGILLVCFGMGMLFSVLVPRFSVEQFWPLVVVALGIARIALPSRSGRYTVYGIVEGAVLCVIGGIMLFTTTGVLSLHMDEWLRDNWSLLAVAAGLIVLGHSLKSPALMVAAICVVAAFCIVGLSQYTYAGPANDVWMPMPYGQIAPDCSNAGASAVAWSNVSGVEGSSAVNDAAAACMNTEVLV